VPTEDLIRALLGEAAIISSDFGGNPPYEKMKQVAHICYRHWLRQANVLFIIGGKSNNTDIYETFRAMGDALREHFSQYGSTPALRRGRPRRLQSRRHGLGSRRSGGGSARLEGNGQDRDKNDDGG
jgi:succinyl-CoA synthetase beta subunit